MLMVALLLMGCDPAASAIQTDCRKTKTCAMILRVDFPDEDECVRRTTKTFDRFNEEQKQYTLDLIRACEGEPACDYVRCVN